MSCFMPYPRCPGGCKWDSCIYAVILEIEEGTKGGQDITTITCPVCKRPIEVEVEMQPQFECRKGPGWKP